MTATPEQVKRLCAASGADEIAALSALERRNGDLLEALLELERQGSARPPARGGFYTTRPQGSTGPASALPVANAGGRRTGGWRRTQEDLSPPGLAAALRDLARRSVENYLEIRRRGRRQHRYSSTSPSSRGSRKNIPITMGIKTPFDGASRPASPRR